MNNISSHAKAERNQEVFNMRLAGYSLQTIGDKFGISRERVRQIIERYSQINNEPRIISFCSKNYHTKKLLKNERFLEATKDKTNEELAIILRISECLVSGYRANIRHATKADNTNSSIDKGRKIEELISYKLTELNIENKLMGYRHPFDILIRNEIRVDVKAAYRRFDPPSQTFANSYRFHIRKRGNTIDFYIFYIVQSDDTFIVPISEFDNYKSKHILITWPLNKPRRNSRWYKYHEAWELLAAST